MTTTKYFEGNIGDACICNVQECLHAASVPKEGTFRDILQFEIHPDSGGFKDKKKLFENVPKDRLVSKAGII